MYSYIQSHDNACNMPCATHCVDMTHLLAQLDINMCDIHSTYIHIYSAMKDDEKLVYKPC